MRKLASRANQALLPALRQSPSPRDAEARLAGKNHAFCPPPNEGRDTTPLKAPQAISAH